MLVVKGRNSQQDMKRAASNLHYKRRSKKTIDNDICAVQPKLRKLAKKKERHFYSIHPIALGG
jgi:hypothetical protein